MYGMVYGRSNKQIMYKILSMTIVNYRGVSPKFFSDVNAVRHFAIQPFFSDDQYM